MRKALTVFHLLLVVGVTTAQNIDFTELNPGPAFFDSRNGAIASGDIDNDGDIDIFLMGKNGNSLHASLYTNDGIGNFTLVTGTSFVGLEFGKATFADIDNDGDLDLLYTGRNTQPQSFAKLYLNGGSGNFTLVSNTPLEPSQSGDIAFEDIDNDGDLDVMMVGYDQQDNGFTKLYQNNGSGSFTALTSSTFEPAKGGSIAFLDYDNDGDKDVIVSGKNNNDTILTKLYSNNGTGLFSVVPNTSLPGIEMGDIGVADTDNDGDLDILLCGQSYGFNNLTQLYLNNGGGSFSLLSNTNFSQTFLSNAEFADFDNDGDPDILITGSIIGSLFAGDIFENTGSNNFIFADTLNPMYLTSAAIEDFDGDNDLDIIMLGINFTSSPVKTRTFINNLNSVSVLEVEHNSNMIIYPNPIDNVINITSNQNLFKEIAIFSLTGSLIYKTDPRSNKFEWNMDNYQNGTYILRIQDENNNITTSKIVKK